jgi:hypothetical protein
MRTGSSDGFAMEGTRWMEEILYPVSYEYSRDLRRGRGAGREERERGVGKNASPVVVTQEDIELYISLARITDAARCFVYVHESYIRTHSRPTTRGRCHWQILSCQARIPRFEDS